MPFKESEHFVWELDKLLGKGSCGNVYQGQNKKNGELVAVKVLNHNALARSIENQIREIEVLKKIDHQNIVKVFAVEIEEYVKEHGQKSKGRVIVMELCNGGSLAKVLEEPENYFGLVEDEFLTVLFHLYAGVKYLRDNNIVHRDLKPHNIMKYIHIDGRRIYKLTDFDAARELSEDQEFYSLYGTEEYLHPDMYEQACFNTMGPSKKFFSSMDLWSMGVTLYHVATGKLPFRPFGGRANRETMHFITTKKQSGVISAHQLDSEKGPIKWEKDLPLNCHLSSELKFLLTEILAGLMEVDPRKKLNYDDFFSFVDGLQKRKIVHIFHVNKIEEIRFYIDMTKCKSLDDFQSLLFHQTRVKSKDQILLYKNESIVHLMQDKVLSFDKLPLTSEDNPIILVNKSNTSVEYVLSEREIFFERSPITFKVFKNNVDLKIDSTTAKDNCTIAHEYLRSIEKNQKISKLFNLSIQNINIIVEQQLRDIERENNVLRSGVHSLNHQFQMMQGYVKSCSTFLPLVKKMDKKKAKKATEQLEKIKRLFEDGIFKDFQRLVSYLVILKPSIDQILENHVKNHSLIVEWENEIAKLMKINNFDLNAVRAQNLVNNMKESYKIIDSEEFSFHKTENNVMIAYLMERLRMQVKCREFNDLVNKDCKKSFASLIELFSDWYKKAQVISIKPELLMNDIIELKMNLKICEDKLSNEIFQEYMSCVENFTQSLALTQNEEIADKKRSDSVHMLKMQVIDLSASQMKIKEDFAETQMVFNEFQDLLSNSTSMYCNP